MDCNTGLCGWCVDRVGRAASSDRLVRFGDAEFRRTFRAFLAGLVLVACAATARAQNTTYWTAGAGDDLWSSSTNWTTGVLPSGNDVIFTNTGASTDPNATTSVLDTGYSINSLTFDNTSGYDQSLYLQQSGANLNVSGGLTVANGGTAALGGTGGSTVTASGGVSVNSGSLNVNSGATLAVTSSLIIGGEGTGNLNLAPNAGLQVGTTANPIGMWVGDASGTGTFAVDSTANPNVSLNLTWLHVGKGNGATGTVDLTKFTGPLSVQNLEIGAPYSTLGTGHFTFGNATLNRLSIPAVNIDNGDLNVNSGATLAVTSSLIIGGEGTGNLNLAPNAGLQVGTTANPIGMWVGDASGTGTFAVDSTANPNVSLNLTWLHVGKGNGATGTVDLTKFTGPLSVQNLEIGAPYSTLGTGHFTFGNATLNRLSIPAVNIDNGDLNVNSGATLAVTSSLIIGGEGTGNLNLAPNAGLQVGTTANPIGMWVGDASGTGTFAVDSTANPNVSLNLTWLHVGKGNGATGTVDLTKFTGPLSVQNLEIGAPYSTLGTGHFTFGNATLNRLSIPAVNIDNGDLNVNSGATLAVTSSLNINSTGSLVAQVGGLGSGLSIDNPSDNALSLAGGTGLIVLDFADPSGTTGNYWGLRWEGDHEAYLASLLDEGRFSGSGQIQVTLGGSSLDLDNLEVGVMQVGGVEYTYIGFTVVPEPSTLALLGIGAASVLAYTGRKRTRTAARARA